MKISDGELEILKFDYENLHNAVWGCHKNALQITSIFIPIIFALQGYFIQRFYELSIIQVFMGALAAWFLVLIWRLMMHLLSNYNSIRTSRLKEIERNIDEQTTVEHLIKHYRLLSTQKKRSDTEKREKNNASDEKREDKSRITWSLTYHFITVLVTILNVSLILLKASLM